MPTRYGQSFADGKPVTDAAGMGLRLNEHVTDIRFAPTTACTGSYIEKRVAPGPTAAPEWRFAAGTPKRG